MGYIGRLLVPWRLGRTCWAGADQEVKEGIAGCSTQNKRQLRRRSNIKLILSRSLGFATVSSFAA